MMQYKGYAAEVEFDDSVGCLHGRVVNSGAYSEPGRNKPYRIRPARCCNSPYNRFPARRRQSH